MVRTLACRQLLERGGTSQTMEVYSVTKELIL